LIKKTIRPLYVFVKTGDKSTIYAGAKKTHIQVNAAPVYAMKKTRLPLTGKAAFCYSLLMIAGTPQIPAFA
jgi:hypothetical protein